jgi:predicted PhzF superfamily epimerase YddE/YHI9
MGIPLQLIDAFSDGPFTGNPAAVALLDHPADATWMRLVAMELNQAETAFLVPRGDGYDLRWFTPTVEIELCGHATLAAAHFLFSQGLAKAHVSFSTLSGILTAYQTGAEIELDFPSEPPSAVDLPHPLTWLPSEPLWVGANRLDWLIQLESADQIHGLEPDFSEVARLGKRGLIVTAPGKGEFDFVSRCFFPQSGVNEDSVTGSAHCALSAYWTGVLGRATLTGFQASKRGGVVKVELVGDRVKLRGRAVTTMAGELRV